MGNYLIPVIPFHKQIIASGKGSYIFDTQGKKYLDLNSGQFCTIFGHSNQGLSNCVREITATIAHTSSGMLSDIVLKTAEKLNAISGELDARSILLSTGAEAVEFAIRYAKHITGRNGLICFEKGYHGLTLGTQSITFGGKYASPAVDNVFSVPIPSENTLEECVEKFSKTVYVHRDKIAGVVIEPIVSVGGMLYPPQKYFEAIREICDKNGILLIFDESQTGFGRTGAWFCFQEFHVVPDMVICSKGIGLGFPISAVLFNGRLLDRKITMTHYSSHQNDPFAAGIVSFGIDYISTNGLLDSNREKGAFFLDQLTLLCKKNPLFRNPRGHGMMLGLDVWVPNVDNYRQTYAVLYDAAAESGVLLQGTDGGRVLRFLPDYLISYDDIIFCVKILGEIEL